MPINPGLVTADYGVHEVGALFMESNTPGREKERTERANCVPMQSCIIYYKTIRITKHDCIR